MSEETKTCPICPRGCDLTSPHCGRGEEYARTGILPQQEGEHSHGHGHEHGHRLQFEKKEQQLVMKYLHHAVGVADHGGITQENAAEMFSVLTEEETVQLAKLLEKLSDHWIEIAPEKSFHHGKR
ncbi:MAG: hypothetical protein ACI4DO_06095 [Roseburia sp.]